MSLILPGSYRASRSNRLRDAMGERNEKAFRNQVAMTNAVAAAVQRVAQERGLSMPQVLDSLVTALVSFVQSQAPVEEWRAASEIVADEVRSRLTVTGNTGEDDHRRKMV